MNKEILKVFDKLDKLNPEAKFLSDSALSTVTEWHDTGCMVLNSIISGSMFGGIPKGRITGFAGPSQAGKTYITNKILAKAQADGLVPVIFDTEMAVDEAACKAVGLNPENVKYVPVQTVEECRNQLVAFLDSIKAANQCGKFIVCIDSLGNLASQKEMEDVEKGKSAMDMGTRAKGLKSMMRTLTFKAAQSNTTIMFVNHTYDDPAAMFPTLVKSQSGGKGPVYLSSVLVQLAKRDEKHDTNNSDDEMIPEANKYSGVTLRALTVKNRFVPPFLEGEMYLNFKTGLDKYSGLREMAINHGSLIQNGSTYALPDGTKLGYFKNWSKNEKIWDESIIPDLEEKLKAAFKYGD